MVSLNKGVVSSTQGHLGILMWQPVVNIALKASKALLRLCVAFMCTHPSKPPKRKLSLMSSVENMNASLCASWLMSPSEVRCDNKYSFSSSEGSQSKTQALNLLRH